MQTLPLDLSPQVACVDEAVAVAREWRGRACLVLEHVSAAAEEDLLKALRARKGQERGKKSAGERTKQAQTELKQARELEEMLIEKALRNADKSWTPVRGNFDMIL